jgi:hypothetical protein
LVFLQKFSIQVEPGYEGIALGMRYNPCHTRGEMPFAQLDEEGAWQERDRGPHRAMMPGGSVPIDAPTATGRLGYCDADIKDVN